ncbi:5663_t:CDS:2 [Cetraspora pellucida]|uniref:5663_t:CDS:1 n=1 Tax=Cetraspora pellucida TaxID=1433469 RepID=A0A9N9BBB9_9GLOM|nr:5663_t:CDS:2 [Cetraspora pellucida]
MFYNLKISKKKLSIYNYLNLNKNNTYIYKICPDNSENEPSK